MLAKPISWFQFVGNGRLWWPCSGRNFGDPYDRAIEGPRHDRVQRASSNALRTRAILSGKFQLEKISDKVASALDEMTLADMVEPQLPIDNLTQLPTRQKLTLVRS